ncbi:MAG: hypothetical protein A2169_04325 [Deltaproteobacteria bacterium RBG_13_47_9]|nr:MAG: hypothetical protein A2169_04325 [Deltaproteobacteria bacterium RBG_13_47_9]
MGPEGLGFKKSQTFNFEIKGIDIGDVDGDKKNEVVIMDYHNIYIFKYDGDKLTLFQKIEHGYTHNFLSLDVADVNRNGIAEIIVTSLIDDNLRSFILEYEEKKFKKITDNAGWYFRVLDLPKEGPILMGQEMGAEGELVGPIFRFVWKKKTFVKGPKMDLPKRIKIFGLALADIRNQGTLDAVILDDSEQLTVQSADGKFSWSSRQRYGGTNNSYNTKKTNDPMKRDRYDPHHRVYIPGRLVTRDLDGDGLKEVMVIKNNYSMKLFERARSFESGEIYGLVWYGSALETQWKTRDISGYIADFQIRDLDNDGEEELVVGVVDSPGEGLLGSTNIKSNILFFKLF